MAGYTPVFSSIFTGTLCGKYPDTAAWLFLLALADKNGEVDMTPQYISGVTGMPVVDLQACIDRFMMPDEYSRSQDEAGRRLVLLAPPRPWGWRIVNFAHYREKARLAAKSQREVESGANKERMTAAHRRSPPPTTSDPLSDADANTDSNTRETQEARAAPAMLALHASLPKEAWEEWLTHRRKRRWPVDAVTLGKHLKLLVSCDTETQRRIIDNSINAGWQGLFPLKGNGAKRPHRDAPTTEELEALERSRAGQ